MSRSPHRLRGDVAECWRAVLFGEIVRAVGGPLTVRAEPTIRLPRSGRWESGLGRITPALDDALGATAFAVAWRWACAEVGANAWPGWPLIAAKSVDGPIVTGDGVALAWDVGGQGVSITDRPPLSGGRSWRLRLEREVSEIAVRGALDVDWTAVDGIADVLAAWFDRPFEILVCE